MKIRESIISLMVMVLFFFIACTPKGGPPPVPIAPTAPEEGKQIIGKEGWEVEWEKVLEAAKKEGSVVVYGSSVAPALNESISLFKKKYGISLEVVSGRGSELRAKLLQERVRGLYIADVFIAGLNTIFGAVKSAGAADPIGPALILPEVKNPKLWHGGELPWGDNDRLVFNFYAYPTHMIGINTEMVKPAEIKSYFDLLDTRWKDRIVINDPTVTGTAFNGFSTLLLSKVVDLDFFRQLARQQTQVLRDQRLHVDWLARGRYPVALWPRSVHVAEYEKAGAPITEIEVKEGSYLSIDGGGLVLINRAPHPNAARVLINWVLSKEGQMMMQNVLLQQSAREDLPTTGFDPIGIRAPGKKYLISANESEEWVLKEQDRYLEMARDAFGPLIR